MGGFWVGLRGFFRGRRGKISRNKQSIKGRLLQEIGFHLTANDGGSNIYCKEERVIKSLKGKEEGGWGVGCGCRKDH